MFPTNILESIPCGVFTVDKELRIVDFNRSAESITGYTKQQVIGRKCEDVFTNEHCQSDCRLKRSLREGEVISHWDMAIPTSKGKRSMVCAATSPIREGGKITGAFMSFRVISELMETYHQVEREKEKSEAILNSIEEGVITINQNWQTTSFNRRAEEITGFRKEEVLGKPCRIIFQTQDVRGKQFCTNECPMKQALINGRPVPERELEITNRYGRKLTLRINVSLLKNGNGEVIGGVETFRDITPMVKLQKELKERPRFENIIGRSKKMQRIYDLIEDIAENDVTVLIQGETGTGKELIASAIHHNSRRKNGPFVKINCSALPETLLESELFGHVKGAFTGAYRDKPGRFELADGGTLLLDEIGDLSPSIQVKLLRVLEEQEFERVGGTKTIRVDVRLIAATNKDLKGAIRRGTFREDLYYRLNVLPIFIPPLRERKEDIAQLVGYFLRKYSRRKRTMVSNQAMQLLLGYNWPGNIRELQNAVEYALLHCKGDEISPQHLPPDILSFGGQRGEATTQKPLEESEKETLRRVLAECGNRRSEAARRLGISRATLWRKMKRLGLPLQP